MFEKGTAFGVSLAKRRRPVGIGEGNIEKSVEGVGHRGGNCINLAGLDFYHEPEEHTVCIRKGNFLFSCITYATD